MPSEAVVIAARLSLGPLAIALLVDIQTKGEFQYVYFLNLNASFLLMTRTRREQCDGSPFIRRS